MLLEHSELNFQKYEYSNKGINETSKKFQSTALHEATGKRKTEHVKLLL